jgi:O-antigen/teichoic acid export membrane protein
MTGNVEQARLRSSQARTGLAAGLLSRAGKFGVNLVVTRLIVGKVGLEEFGVLALAMATIELVSLADLAIYELTGYEVAAAEDRPTAEHGLAQALLLSLVPAIGGTLILCGLAFLAGAGLTQATAAHGPLIRQVLLAGASTFAVNVVGNVYCGVLLGYGWISELNAIWTACFLFDFVAVMVGLQLGFDLTGIQWLRAGVPVFRFAVVIGVLRWRHLPIPRFRRWDFPGLRRMFRFGIGYNVSKGLGGVEYACDIPIAQLFVPAAHLGSYANADQWANKPYRFSHAIFESLYHRLARAFRAGASEAERQDGIAQYLGATLLITVVVAPVAAALSVVGPWLFGLWLGRDEPLAAALLPWLAAAWTLNAIASPSTCLILATGRFQLSVRAHLIAVVVNVIGDVVLGRQYGMHGVVVATLIANVLLTALLSRAACRIATTAWSEYLVWNAAPLAIAAVCAITARSNQAATPVIVVAMTLATAAGAGLVAWRAPHLPQMWAVIRRRS